jgi:uncharacterized lipoprotein YehR (DUF1307 family)
MACAYITDLATLIYNNLGAPSDLTISSIQTKLVSTGFLGKLNNKINTSYAIVSGDISPQLDTNEQAIYAQMYVSEYCVKKINAIIGGTEIAWTTVKDGDSTITRSSQTEMAKIYKDLKKQTDEELDKLVGSYRINASSPISVDYAPPPIQ